MLIINFFSYFYFFVEYIGCYNDKFSASERDLVGSLFLEENRITPEFCEKKCSIAHFKYFGLQYGAECWCGNDYGKYGKAVNKNIKISNQLYIYIKQSKRKKLNSNLILNMCIFFIFFYIFRMILYVKLHVLVIKLSYVVVN
jgi:hypothetical protein